MIRPRMMLSTVFLGVLLSAGARAQQTPPDESQRGEERTNPSSGSQAPAVPSSPEEGSGSPGGPLGELIAKLQEALQVRDRAILHLGERLRTLENEVAALRARLGEPSARGIPTPASGTSPASSSSVETRQPPAAPSEDYDKEERLARAALDRALITRGGILLPPGMVEFEQGVSYFNASADVISIDGFTIFPVLVVGDIVSERVRRDILLSSFTWRIGLPKDLQVDLRLPYGYEISRRVTADNRQTTQRSFGLGDLDLGITRQWFRERGSRPAVLTGLRWKLATGSDPFRLRFTEPALGTGFYSLQGTVTAVKSSDPAVFFGGLSYSANLPASKFIQGLDPVQPDQRTLGRFDPGDTFGFQLGTALALNPEASVSFGWEQRFTRDTSINRQRIPGSFLNEGMFRFGTSYVYAPGRTVDLGIGLGLTRDVPHFQFTVALPFRIPFPPREPRPH